jgi:polar amino acid transport system substrate-binding protein
MGGAAAHAGRRAGVAASVSCRGERKSRVIAAVKVLVVAVFAVALVGCTLPFGLGASKSDSSSEDTTQTLTPKVSASALVEEGVLTVGLITSNGAPEVISSGSKGYVGYDVDVAAALAQELGLTVRYVEFEYVKDALNADVDVIMGVGASDASSLTVVSTYIEQATALFTRASAPEVATMQEVAGNPVGVQTGSTAQKLLENSNLLVSPTTYTNLNDAFDALENGQVDFVACQAFPGGYLASLASGVSFAGTLDAPSAKGIGIAGVNTELISAAQDAMSTLTSNGVIDILRARWVGSMPLLTTNTQIEGVEIDASTTSTSSDALASGTVGAGTGAVTSLN